MADENNTFSNVGEVFNNLVAHTYIYSHTSHFEADLNNRIAFGRVNKVNRVFTLDKLISIRDALKRNIIAITEKSNLFYEDMEIKGRDSVNFGDNGIDVHLDGAREFERRYLMGGASDSKSIKDRAGEINDIMVSISYQEEVFSRLKAMTENNGIANKTRDIATTFFQGVANRGLDGAAVKALGNSIQNNAFNAIEAVDILFATKTNRKAGEATLTQIQQGLLQEFLQTLDKDTNNIFKKVQNNKEELKKLRNSIKREISGNVFKLNDVAEVMYSVLIEHLAERGVQLGDKQKKAIKEAFLAQLKPALSSILKHGDDTNLIDFQVRDARLNGLILEQSAVLSINVDNLFNKRNIDFAKLGKSVAKVTGQERNDKGQQIKADLRVTGKSGNIYDIQAKNSFSNKDYDAIHIQSDIKVQTFADEIFTSEWEKQLFEFFILNRAFLSRAGLENATDTKSGVRSSVLGTKDNETLILMIQFFLNQSIFHLVGSEVQRLIKTDADLQKVKSNNLSFGNLFFIFRKNYFMPVSVFLFGAVNCLNQLIAKESKQNSPDFLNTIGRLTYSRELQGFSENYTYTYNMNFRRKKLEAIENYPTSLPNAYRYPENLVAVGAEVGEKMLKDATFKGVNFSLSIKKLDELLK